MGFLSVGQVDTKGKARKLPIKADIRKALCFPGGSTLMISHIQKESSYKSAISLQVFSLLKSHEKSTTASVGQIQHPGVENLKTEDLGILSYFTEVKKVKGGHMIACQSENGCVSRGNKTTNKEHCYKIMFMNIADYAKKSNLTKIIEDLGGSVTSDGRVSTHVITGKVRKTLNFCTALCSGAWVISPTWLKESFREGRFVDEMDYIVKDDKYEVKYRTNLKNTVLKARANPPQLKIGVELWIALVVFVIYYFDRKQDSEVRVGVIALYFGFFSENRNLRWGLEV
ncbi:hypothetical protein L2E82_09180 [Cichorium intybus]|uniref:Uncharacterized protein n=1 Tax=Cichorium intybus TaxID=13427 RepID=A0ACB9G8Q9_CICIN|nr:hypothetical protein L2E82_09180 [Cichorium intybus]